VVFGGHTWAVEIAGRLLVALPALTEAPFRRTVILMLNHDEGGAVGVIINRPTQLSIADALPKWDDRAAEPAVVFEGGPVQPELAIAIGHDGAGALDTIDLEGDPDARTAGSMRVFSGYAGWSGGQLESEIVDGAWVVVDAEPGDAFRTDAEDLWHLVLRRQDEPLRHLGLLPDDLSVN
jgi:putative transcriptional regulator